MSMSGTRINRIKTSNALDNTPSFFEIIGITPGLERGESIAYEVGYSDYSSNYIGISKKCNSYSRIYGPHPSSKMSSIYDDKKNINLCIMARNVSEEFALCFEAFVITEIKELSNLNTAGVRYSKYYRKPYFTKNTITNKITIHF